MTTSSSNYTGLYGGGTATAIPNTAYGNANVVSLLAAGSDGANTVGNIVAVGNVSGNYFIGNGALLTGIAASYGNAQVASYLASGLVTSNVITTANISGQFILGNGSQLTGLPATYANANVVTLLANFGSNSISTTGNVTAGNFVGSGAALTSITGANVTGTVANATYAVSAGSATSATTAGTVTTAAQPNITSVGTLTSLSSSGNVTAAFFIGNGSLLSNINAGNIVGAYGNANVTSLLAGFGSNTILTTGNITGGNIIGNGSALSAITGGNVTGTVANATFATSAGSATTATTATTAGTVTTAAQPNITSVGTLTSLSSSGNISATGNITGSYFFGNGSQLTGLPATYGNANVATFLANFGSNSISTTGNITAGNILSGTFQAVSSAGGALKNASGATQASWGGGGGNNFSVSVATTVNPANAAVAISPTGTGTVAIAPVGGGAINNMIIGNVTPAAVNATTVSATGNVTGGNVNTGGQVSATGNISGSFFIGNGSQLTGIATSYGNANVANFLANFGSNILSTTGNVTGSNVIASILLTAPQLITTGASGNISGVNYITANYFAGDGSLLTNINAANITGAYGNANVSNFLANGFGSNTITTTGNITGGNINTGGIVSSTGNIQTAASIVAPTNGRYRGDFTSLSTAGRTMFQTTGTGTTASTFISAMPGPNHVAGPTVTGAATGMFSNNDLGNSSIFGMYSLGSDARIWSLASGTGNVNNMTFRFGNAGNLGATLTAAGTFSAVGNVQGGNILGIGSSLTGINAFGNVAVAGQTTVSADTTTDTLTLTAGTNIIITTDAANNKVTITSSAGESISPLMLMGG